MYPALGMKDCTIALDCYVNLAQLIRIVRVRYLVVPSDIRGLFLKQLVNTLDLMLGVQRSRYLAFSKLASPGFAAFGKNSRILLPTRLSGTKRRA